MQNRIYRSLRMCSAALSLLSFVLLALLVLPPIRLSHCAAIVANRFILVTFHRFQVLEWLAKEILLFC